jgi:hypothetical protein
LQLEQRFAPIDDSLARPGLGGAVRRAEDLDPPSFDR